jgi:cation:H+ antiporter
LYLSVEIFREEQNKMMADAGELLIMLVVILIAAEVFTNALEHLGERLGISEGVTGSLFAAVGTAMPESMVPLLAFFAGTGHAELDQDIGIGAILGAPLMLSTLSLFLMGLSVTRRRGANGILAPEPTGLKRDLNFFLVAFAIAIIALLPLSRIPGAHVVLASGLLFTYFIYVMLTLRVSAQLVREGHGTEAHRDMLLCKLGLPDNMFAVTLQLLIGLALLVAGAKGFISGVEQTSHDLGISPLLLSLLIVPVATELPEKVNSIIWIRRRKDTLAFGNITGAMVFQGTILPAMGLLFTPWEARHEIVVGLIITSAAALWLRVLVWSGKLRVWHLFINGCLYAVYITLMVG